MNVFCILLLFILGFNQGIKIRVRKRWYLPQVQISRQITAEQNHHIPFYLYGQQYNQPSLTMNLEPNLVYLKRKLLHWPKTIDTGRSQTNKYDIDELRNSDINIRAYKNSVNNDLKYKSETDEVKIQAVNKIIDDTEAQQKQSLVNTGQVQYEDAKDTSSKDKIEATLFEKAVDSPTSSDLLNNAKISDFITKSQLSTLELMNEPAEVINEGNENLDVKNGIKANHHKIKVIVSKIPAKRIVTPYKDNIKRGNNDFAYKNSNSEINDNLLSYFIGKNEPVVANDDQSGAYDAIKINHEASSLPNNYPIYPDIENFKSVKDDSIDESEVNLENKQKKDEIKQLANLISKTYQVTDPYNKDDVKGNIIYPALSSFGRYKIDDINIDNQKQLVNFEPMKKVAEVTSNNSENYDNLLIIKGNEANHQKDNINVPPEPTKYLFAANGGYNTEDDLMKVIENKNDRVNYVWNTDYLNGIKIDDGENILPNNYPIHSGSENWIDQTEVNLENKQKRDEIKRLANLIFKTHYLSNPYNEDDEKRNIIYQLLNLELNGGNDSEGDLMKVFQNKKDLSNSLADDVNVKSDEKSSSNSLSTVNHNKESLQNENVDKNTMNVAKDKKLSYDPVPENLFASINDINVNPINQNTPISVPNYTYRYRDILELLHKINQKEKGYISNEKNSDEIRFLAIINQIYPELNNLWRFHDYPGYQSKVPWDNKRMEQREPKSKNPFDVISNINIINKRYRNDKKENIPPCANRPNHNDNIPQKMTEFEEMDSIINQPNHIPKIQPRVVIRLIKHIGENNLPLQVKNDIFAQALDKETSIEELSDIYEYNNRLLADVQMAPTHNVRYIKSQQKVPGDKTLKINEVENSPDDPNNDVVHALIKENSEKIIFKPSQTENKVQTEIAPQETTKSEENINFRSIKSKEEQFFDSTEDEHEIQTTSPSVLYNYEREPIPKLTTGFDILTKEIANFTIESPEMQQNNDIANSDFNTTEEIPNPQDISDKNTQKTSESMILPNSPIIYISMLPDSNINRGKKSVAPQNYGNMDQKAANENAVLTDTENVTMSDAHNIDISDGNRNATEQTLEEHNKTEVIAANNTNSDDWSKILINVLSSEASKIPTADSLKSSESLQNVLEGLFISNDVINPSEQINKSKHTDTHTLQQHLNQILNIMMTDLLKLYYSCHTQSNEELLKEWKIFIKSALEKQCETKSEH